MKETEDFDLFQNQIPPDFQRKCFSNTRLGELGLNWHSSVKVMERVSCPGMWLSLSVTAIALYAEGLSPITGSPDEPGKDPV